jgi:hypothetical protein
MPDRWDDIEMAYNEVKRALDAYWQVVTRLRAQARVPRADIDAAVHDMELANRALQDLARILVGSGSESMIWTSTREHP